MQSSPKTVTKAKSAKAPPLYRKLADTLRDEVTSGMYAVGDLLPTEQDLCERFETSRYTVREALRLLMEDGLIERRQGRGTEVTSQKRTPGFAQSITSIEQLYTYAEDTQLFASSIALIVPEDGLALQLGRAPGREWLLLDGLRKSLDGSTICVTKVFINSDFADLADQIPSLQGPIHLAISERFGVDTAQVQQRIAMERLDPSIARHLDLTAGEWGVSVRRRYLAKDDGPILVSLNWHRPEDFNYSQVLHRD